MTLREIWGATVDGDMKLAHVVAQTIEREIIHNGWPPGHLIGTEADLIIRSGVSRAVLREAIRILEHHMTAHMRKGPGGGLVVAMPDASVVSVPISLYLEYRHARPEDVFEARITIELAAAELACENLTEDGIALLQSALEAGRLDPESSRELHFAIADLSGNAVYSLFARVLCDLIDSRISRQSQGREEAAVGVHRAHEAIVEAIMSRDVAIARHRMHAHLEAMRLWISSASDDES